MRIVSLLPAATEICFTLGLGEALVGVSPECDHPADARSKPIVSRSLLDYEGKASGETGRRGGGAADHTVPRMARPSLRRGPLGPRDDRPRGRRRRPRSTRREVPPNLVQ